MVTLPAHRTKMTDAKAIAEKISPEFQARRAKHLEKLRPLEEYVRKVAPLPIAYDVTRQQPPYFNEFTYTELLGGIYVAPQSTEAALRVVDKAIGDQTFPFDITEALAYADKYVPTHVHAGNKPKHVAFLPGSNIFTDAVSREKLTAAMHQNPNLVLKPHPMTRDDLLRDLGREFGYHRVLEPNASGYDLINSATKVYSVETSELGLYSLLAGIDTVDITKQTFQSQAAYHPFYWAAARDKLQEALSGPSGFLHPDDPDATDKADRFFANAMSIRAALQPLAQEFGPVEWAAAIQLRQGKVRLA